MNQEELRKEAAERHAREVCGEYYDLMYEETAIEYSMGQLCNDDFIAGAEWEAEREKWNVFDELKPTLGKSVLISFISTLNDKRVYKADELLKDGTFRFTTIINGIMWSEITPPKTSKP